MVVCDSCSYVVMVMVMQWENKVERRKGGNLRNFIVRVRGYSAFSFSL